MESGDRRASSENVVAVRMVGVKRLSSVWPQKGPLWDVAKSFEKTRSPLFARALNSQNSPSGRNYEMRLSAGLTEALFALRSTRFQALPPEWPEGRALH